MKTIALVGGVIANKPGVGGAAWTRLNWVLGLKKLGFDVYFIEQIDRKSCVNAAGQPASFEDSDNLAYFEAVTREAGLDGAAALIFENGEEVAGFNYTELLDLAGDAAFLVNITGHLKLEPFKKRIRRRAYVDLDPGFTQFWHVQGYIDSQLAGHEYYFTIGENIGMPDCPIPTNGIAWRPTRQPVVLENWPVCSDGERNRFTTVAAWRGPYDAAIFDGKRFGLKAHEFRKLLDLPGRVDATFEIALDIHEADARDRQTLEDRGWKLVDPRLKAGDPKAFRRYVQTSGAEFSVAKEIYVETNSGWFSDRTVRYLASGKPALVQDTGLERNYCLGEGLLTFRKLDEAVAGARRILENYDAHCGAARHFAEKYFDSDKVLGRLTEEILQ